MLKEKARTFENIDCVIQVILTLASFFLSFIIFCNLHAYNRQYLALFFIISFIWYILLRLFNLNKIFRIKVYASILIEYALCIVICIFLLMFFISLFKFHTISRIVVISFGIINFLFLSVYKVITYSYFKNVRRKGKNTRNLLIIADKSSDNLIDSIIANSYWGYKLKIIVSDDDYIINKYQLNSTVLPGNIDIGKFIELEEIDEVIYALENFKQKDIQRLIYSCQEVGAVFRLESYLMSMLKSKAYLDYFGENPVLTFRNTPSSYFQLKIKDFLDTIVAFFIIIFASPLFLAIALAIKISSPGPVFFKQVRVGLRNRKFKVFKFRTMVINADELKKDLMEKNEQQGPVFKIKKDPRITKIGHILRKTSLDELPQFFNVLKGDMSIVGPVLLFLPKL